MHFEENNVEDFRYPGEDGWFWESVENRGRDRPYFLRLDRVASGDGTVTVRLGSDSARDTVRVEGSGSRDVFSYGVTGSVVQIAKSSGVSVNVEQAANGGAR